jgi:putative transposase
MKGSRYTEEQIIRILQEVEQGTGISTVCRTHGISEGSSYRWRQKYGGLDVPDAQRLKALEAENGRLKRLLVQQMLDTDALKELVAKKW